MKRMISVLMVVALMFPLTACFGDSPEAVIEDFVDAMEDFLDDMDAADDSADVKRALENLTDEMENIVPRIKKMAEEMPEFKEILKGKLPQEFEKFKEKMNDVMRKFLTAMAKLIRYLADEGVTEARKKLMEVMDSI